MLACRGYEWNGSTCKIYLYFNFKFPWNGAVEDIFILHYFIALVSLGWPFKACFLLPAVLRQFVTIMHSMFSNCLQSSAWQALFLFSQRVSSWSWWCIRNSLTKGQDKVKSKENICKYTWLAFRPPLPQLLIEGILEGKMVWWPQGKKNIRTWNRYFLPQGNVFNLNHFYMRISDWQKHRTMSCI